MNVTRHVKDWRLKEYDAIIDARSPAEFLEDHIPGAINLPVLDDKERDRVGTIYKQQSPFQARIIGAALVSRNIGRHIEHTLLQKPGEWRALLYCWRGGQRSHSFYEVLSQIGWRVDVLEGGYKTYRAKVIEEIDDYCSQLRPVIIQGATGTGKTRLLNAAMESGFQGIDLEGLAAHKGSVLGGDPAQHQPTQKAFESALWRALASLDLDKPVLLEAESSKVGDLHLPKLLWKRMKEAPQVEITLETQDRVALLLEEYDHWVQNPEGLIEKLRPLRYRLGQEVIDRWESLIREDQWHALVSDLLQSHYDSAYQTAANRRQGRVMGPLRIPQKDAHGDSAVLEALQTWVGAAIARTEESLSSSEYAPEAADAPALESPGSPEPQSI